MPTTLVRTASAGLLGLALLLLGAAPAHARVLPPITQDDAFAIPIDGVLDVPAPGVLANDSDPDGTPIEVLVDEVVVDGPALVSLGADGALSVAPAIGFEGYITITYAIVDGDTQFGGTALVTIAVGDPGAIPLAFPDAYEVVPGQPLVVDAAHGILANDTDADGDVLEIVPVNTTIPDFGSLEIALDGSFVYTPFADPDPGFDGLDHFMYQATDGINRTFQQVVSFTYLPAPAPVATSTTAAPAAPTTPPTATPTTAATVLAAAATAPPTAASLPRTGEADGPLALVAIDLVATGSLLTAAARRRSRLVF